MLKFTLGEKLGQGNTKPVGSTCEKYAGRLYREPCGCGRGFIEYIYNRYGGRVANYSLCTWGRDLSGRLEMVPCCKQCADEQGAEIDAELCDED